MEFFDPEHGVADKERLDLRLRIIEDECAPFLMLADTRILVLVTGRTVEAHQTFLILREMRRYPVENDRDSVLMEMIHEEFKICRCAEPAGHRIVAYDLISPGIIQRMLEDRHELYMRVPHLLTILRQILRNLTVVHEISVFMPLPGSQMHFVDRDRTRCTRMDTLACESLIVPGVIIRIIKDRCIGRSRLTVTRIRIDLIYFRSVRSVDMVLIPVPLLRPDDIGFPDTRIPDLIHVICFRIPVVKISDYTDCLRMGRPHPEQEALLPVIAHERTGPEVVITLIILARIEKIRLIHHCLLFKGA